MTLLNSTFAACQGGTPRISSSLVDQEPQFIASVDAGGDSTISNIVGIDAGCVDAKVRGQLRPSNLLFIVDRSGSMNCNLPEDGQSSEDCNQFPIRRYPDLPSKWELTLQAIQAALTTLAATNRVKVALSTFPDLGTACAVASGPDAPFVQLDSTTVEELMGHFASLTPYGNTPLVGATILSYQYLLDLMRQQSLVGDAFVVLVTDGKETCRTDEVTELVTIDAPNALQLLGIRTFAIGVPGSEDAREFLSSLAEAGGTVRSQDCYYGPAATDGNCHFDMTTTTNFSADLLDALTRINAEIMSCSFDIPETTGGAAVDLTRVNVLLNGQSIPFSPNHACGLQDQGWQYAPGNTSIRLCGTSCAMAQLPGAEVSIILGCTTSIW